MSHEDHAELCFDTSPGVVLGDWQKSTMAVLIEICGSMLCKHNNAYTT